VADGDAGGDTTAGRLEAREVVGDALPEAGAVWDREADGELGCETGAELFSTLPLDERS